ncbi:hypothetical protein L211DRAFT_843703 [Terfezia boudieri ATCC MYA-4762]|uniref:Uncharacterized protein n=1 Tax=Terfezia boudieri ATCC MYA-4762 TaxID=1051890 RepID=A0A3N4LA53_9PEZI|nr:hypothetical protein L211DRAFT_843703 [Terfezia boudieri ATCC MYA-4762]
MGDNSRVHWGVALPPSVSNTCEKRERTCSRVLLVHAPRKYVLVHAAPEICVG